MSVPTSVTGLLCRGQFLLYVYCYCYNSNQSINQRSSQIHTRAKEKPHPSTTTRGANPASRSDGMIYS